MQRSWSIQTFIDALTSSVSCGGQVGGDQVEREADLVDNLSHVRVRNPLCEELRANGIGCAQEHLNAGLGSEATEEVVSHGVRARAATDRVRGASRPTPRDDQGPRGRGRRPPTPPAGRAEAGPHARRAPARDEGPAGPGRLPEREALRDVARGARAHRRAARRGREAHDAAVGLRDVPRHQRRRHRRHLHRGPQDARRAPPRARRRRAAARPGGRAQRVAERRARPLAPTSPARS